MARSYAPTPRFTLHCVLAVRGEPSDIATGWIVDRRRVATRDCMLQVSDASMLDMAVRCIDLLASTRRRPQDCKADSNGRGMRGGTNSNLQALHHVGKISARFSILIR